MPTGTPILSGYPPSTAVAVLDPDDVLIIDERAQQPVLPGSTVKLMTALVALTVLDDLDLELTVEAEDLRRGSGNNLLAGDTLTFWDALHNLLLPSSNTTAGMLVRTAGSVLSPRRPASAFISAMNYERIRHRLQDSRFTNGTGLYREGMPVASTAHDIARLVRVASRHPVISQLWSKKNHAMTIGGVQPRTVEIVSTIPASSAPRPARYRHGTSSTWPASSTPDISSQWSAPRKTTGGTSWQAP